MHSGTKNEESTETSVIICRFISFTRYLYEHHSDTMQSLTLKRDMDVIPVEAVQPTVIDEEVQREAVINVENEEGQSEITEGQPEMQSVIHVENEEAHPPRDHYVRREFFRNLITSFMFIVSLYLTDSEIKIIRK